MAYDSSQSAAVISCEIQPRKLSPAALRALVEAEARRNAVDTLARPTPKELQGPKGPETTRYGDRENKGSAYDF